jgi:hypothetical protein
MMHDEFVQCPFERAVVGGKGHILLRRNHDHAKCGAEAIRRRTHPEWSRLRDAYKVGEAA